MTDEPLSILERITAAKARYDAAAGAVQSGVAAMPDHANLSAKHLRVGVNMAFSDGSALAALLIDKGIITTVEYVEALADAAESEKARYEAEVSERLGRKVTLGGVLRK